MLRKRVIVCLNVQDGRVVKGVNFQGLRDVGDPVELAQRYEAEGADEIVFLDISAAAEGRRTLLDIVRRTAENLFVPLTVGGGISDVSDVALALRAGADKVSINTAAVTRPELISEAAQRFGSQCIVASIDTRLERRQIEMLAHAEGPAAAAMAGRPAMWYRVFTHGGRNSTELNAIEWTRRCAELGAGEILITSIDQDGRRAGYDLELTARVGEAVSVPVIASGGAGTPEHVRDAFLLAGADAALLAGILHDGSTTVGALKRFLANAGIDVRVGPMGDAGAVNVAELRDVLDFAVEVAWRAGRATLAHYQTGIVADTKADHSPVTEADRTAEHIARQLIGRRYPADAILGEEEGETHAGADRRWILDPIDGTRTFIRGVPLFGVLIALEFEADAVLGVMHFPALDETVHAGRGLGCWWNGRRALVSDETRLDRALVVTTNVENIEREHRGAGWNTLRKSVGMCRTWGDCYGYALVATGRAEVMLDPVVSLWDAAALSPIIEEAGGVFTDLDGRAGHRVSSALATNTALAREVRSILRGQP